MSAQPSVHPHKWDDVGDTVLYDVMAEAATALGGMYIWLADRSANEAEEDHWLALDRDVMGQRRAVDPADRAAMVNAIEKWGDERHRLSELYPTA